MTPRARLDTSSSVRIWTGSRVARMRNAASADAPCAKTKANAPRMCRYTHHEYIADLFLPSV